MVNRDFEKARLAGTVLLLVVSIHGVTNRRWSELHTLGVIISVAAMLGGELTA